ncbi:hypothetical protein Tco_0645349, partial [Tanacetum coccineum]
KIHACPNGCMLFWDGNEKEEVCSICGASRWKPAPEVASNDSDEVAPNDPDELRKRKYEPIGDEANELTKFLGTLVRMSQHIGIEYEEWRKTQKNNGVPPSRGGMYCLTRTYQDGRVVNAKAGKVVEAIKTMGESRTAQETRTDGSHYWIDDDLAKVKGPERGDLMRLVVAVKEHIPGLDLSTIISRANTNMESQSTSYAVEYNMGCYFIVTKYKLRK